MLYKTSGIVLRQQKYTDNKRIVHIFTEKFGKKSFIIFSNSKSKNKFVQLFQPFFILNIEFSQNKNNLATLKEANIGFPFKTIPFNTQKSAIVFFLSEIIWKIYDEQYIDEKFYHFFENAVKLLDNQSKPANFHIAFMTDLLYFLGLNPVKNFSETNKYFSIPDAKFFDKYDNQNCMDEKSSAIFYELLNSGLSKSENLIINKKEKKNVLDKILDFYTFHYSHLKNLKTLGVLEELFA